MLCEDWLFNEISDTLRSFLGNIPLSREGEPQVTCEIAEEKGVISAHALLLWQGKGFTGTSLRPIEGGHYKGAARKAAKRALYDALKEATNINLPWGALTGIRPTKLLHDLRKTAGPNAEGVLAREYDVSPEKISLLQRILSEQARYALPEKNDLDIYVGIPFCPTRCAYCSFGTTDATKHQYIPDYLQALQGQIDAAKEIVQKSGARVRCLYIGGGTPTILTEGQLEALLKTLAAFAPGTEYCLEAGRPDTITKEKLLLAKEYGVNRLCINPQSMHEETLKRIGRRHSVQDCRESFYLARELGFANINMDVIAALPGEGPQEFLASLAQLALLGPENITVHALSLKSGSRLKEGWQGVKQQARGYAAALAESGEMLAEKGYAPYYLYRQKNQAENLENVGYTKPGFAGIYNLDNMEERASILALGAGAISKRVEGGRIERMPNVKGIFEYLSRTHQQAARLQTLFLPVKGE